MAGTETSCGSVRVSRAGHGSMAGDYARLRELVEARLGEIAAESPEFAGAVARAVRYALLAPGKRVRPLLTYLVIDPDPEAADTALDLACAIEMVHTASLILDDLPCMDDASLRRRRPATHVAFGQSTAILASIALMTRAFGIIAGLRAIDAERRTRLTGILAEAVGWNGLVCGQELDVSQGSALCGPEAVEHLNWLKTGVLFAAAVEMGAVARGLDERRKTALRRFARHLGLAFQALDDILDRTASTAHTGKDVGKDTGKATVISLLGSAQAHAVCRQHLGLAEQALAASGVAPGLIGLMLRQLFEQTGGGL